MIKQSKIETDIIKHFEELNFEVVAIRQITKQSKEDIPFNINEWSPRLGTTNLYKNHFWKVKIKNNSSLEFTKWVNTGHLFGIKLYLIVKD